MARSRKPEYQIPIEAVPHDSLARRLIAVSPAFANEGDAVLWASAFPPPGDEYPMSHEPTPGEANAYRDWLISVLAVLANCYPPPANMALECLRKSLIEVNRGITPNLFKVIKQAKGGKSNFAAQEAMNTAVLAASYIHDICANDMAYEAYLAKAGTNKREIDAWKNERIDPAYKNNALLVCYDLKSAEIVLTAQIENYRSYRPRKAKRAS